MQEWDVVIIGAGAAGLTAAYFAGHSSHSALLLERTDKAGKKILISGGTRCNILPVHLSKDDYITNSSVNLMNRVFKSWCAEDCKTWLSHHIGIKLNCETETNKWFPASNSAKEVRDKLLDSVTQRGTEIRYNQKVYRLTPQPHGWIIHIEDEQPVRTRSVIIATGGKSIPTMGTDGLGYSFLKALGLPVEPTYPALTPLHCEHPGPAKHSLAGVSLNCNVTAKGENENYHAKRTGFLFTHNGISGPSVLDCSHISTRALQNNEPSKILVNWVMENPQWVDNRLQDSRKKMPNVVKELLPGSLAEALCHESGLSERFGSQLRTEKRRRLVGCTHKLFNVYYQQ